MTSYCITFSSCSARIKFCFHRISPTAKAGKMRRWKFLNARIFPRRKRKSCCPTTRCGFSASRSPVYSLANNDQGTSPPDRRQLTLSSLREEFQIADLRFLQSDIPKGKTSLLKTHPYT